jgi:PAS domain S-box-containing protein
MDRTDLTRKLHTWGRQLEHMRQRLGGAPGLSQTLHVPIFEELSALEAELSQQAEVLAAGQHATEATRQRYQELFEFAPDGYLVLDTEGVIQEANRAAAILLQVPQDRLLRKPLTVFIATGDRRRFRTQLAQLHQPELIHTWEARVQPRHGSPFAALFSIAPACHVDGRVAGLRCLFRDITARQQAEEQLKNLTTLLDLAQDGIMITDMDTKIRYWNRGAEAMYGWASAEVLGQVASTVLHTHLPRPWEEIRAEVLHQGHWEGELEDRRRDGTRLVVASRWTVQRDAAGQPVAFLGINTDITERKRAEEALHRSATRLEILHVIDQAILRAQSPQATAEAALRQLRHLIPCWGADVMLFDWEAKQAIPFATAAGEETTSLAGDRVTLEAIGGEDLEALRAGRVHVVEDILHLPTPPPAVRARQVAGAQSYVRVPLLVQEALFGSLDLWDDRPSAFTPEQVEIACEVADELAVALQHARLLEQVQRQAVELEQRVRSRTAQLEAANKELEGFSYAVAHDLRAPLRAIHSFSHILLDDYAPHLDAEAQGYLQRVSANALHVGQQIDTLLEFASLSRRALAKQTVAPTPLVQQVLDELRPTYEHRQVEIVIGDLPTCQADPLLLTQVWANLLENALKFTRGRAVAHIEVGCYDRQGEQVYFVRDNGVGFEMQYVAKLFGVFQRLHRVEDYEGTGVGLALTQRIVQRHGGRIWAEAAMDQGATFYFALGE